MTSETMIDLFELDGLSTRSMNALSRAGYRSVDDFKGVKPDDLLGLDGFGKRGLAELERSLDTYGVRFLEPVLTVRALIDSLRRGPRNTIGVARLVDFPTDEVAECLAILEEHGVVSHDFSGGTATFRLNPFFLRVCDGRVAA